MKILHIPTSGNYIKRINIRRWTFISVILQIILLLAVLLKDWVWNSKETISVTELKRFLLYFPVVIIFQLFVFRFSRTYIFGVIFYLGWITAQFYFLLNSSTSVIYNLDLLLLLLSILVFITIVIIFYTNQSINNQKKENL